MAEYAAMVVVSAVAQRSSGRVVLPGVQWLIVGKLGLSMLYPIVCLLIFLAKLTILLYLYFWVTVDLLDSATINGWTSGGNG